MGTSKTIAGCLLISALAAGSHSADTGKVTTGAAPGYVADQVCAGCHPDIWSTYRHVAMARSFYRPRRQEAIEDFDNARYLHAPSKQVFEMAWQGDRLVFKRYRQGQDGRPLHVFEQPVDWILGSGNHTRTYLFRTPGGELYQLPIAWYPQPKRWAMAPGFESADHQGVERQVRRECMFCHNAYPDVPAGSDRRNTAHFFPAELPEGIGCQRCHGPGAEHVRIAQSDPIDFQKLAAAIVNPADLPAERRDEVCDSCHLQPSVVLMGLRRFGRGTYSFRPGEDLDDYLVAIDVEEEGRERWERFEINHHPYRLRQSRCALESEPGKLSCLTCHDPHRKVEPAKRAAHYRAACLTCHQRETLIATKPIADHDPETSDCVGCHMAKRRTQDVIEVVMTDHLIRRWPGGEELVAPLEKHQNVLTDVVLADPPRDLKGMLGEVYRAAALVRATGGGSKAAVERLTRLLAELRPAEIEPWLDLAEGQIKQHRWPEAEQTLLGVLGRAPEERIAEEWLGITRVAQRRGEEAIAGLRALLEKDPDRIEARFNLGRILLGYEKPAEAVVELRRAVELRPNFAAGWYQLGAAHVALGQRQEAAAAYRRCLEVNPDYRDAAAKLAGVEGENSAGRAEGK